MTIRLPSQGFMSSPPLELLAELVTLGHVQIDIPLREDVSRMHVLLITFPSDLENESSCVVGFLRSGDRCFPLP